jgi:hypothetical protein
MTASPKRADLLAPISARLASMARPEAALAASAQAENNGSSMNSLIA